ncbi:hypothetical protein JCM21142_104419 [Saccharicrinis fermentans DSM 9555 = JCM 21142]|uniref:Uncharacterized protein n=1 Tax=Saccharicrinis fermentans DSM 9555 = JCM 21142 TaxID=869213 RepID=W7YTB6_9BACT|nr:hypothetical protein JCM21142_104419 [Saccharicrinis fermentans DSM 9555 = JCM 21142]
MQKHYSHNSKSSKAINNFDSIFSDFINCHSLLADLKLTYIKLRMGFFSSKSSFIFLQWLYGTHQN